MGKSIRIIIGGVFVLVILFSGARVLLDVSFQEINVQGKVQKFLEQDDQEEDTYSEEKKESVFPILEESMEDEVEEGPSDIHEDLQSEDPKQEAAQEEEAVSADYSPNISIKKNLISWGYEAALNRDIYAVILHSSYNSLEGDKYNTDAIIDIYKSYEVGAHYIIDRGGTIIQLVEEKNIAYHAGVSSLPNGETDVNRVSIGIEIITHIDEEPMEKQYDAVNDLLGDIKDRHNIQYVLGHDDIAPNRKSDPWGFNWSEIKSGKQK